MVFICCLFVVYYFVYLFFSLEKSRTDQLLKVTQKAASSALASVDVNHTRVEGDHTHQAAANSSITVQVGTACSMA